MGTLIANENPQKISGVSSPQEKRLSDAIQERRATPAFSSDPVEDEDLKTIVRAGQEAPSSYNLQPWRFVVVRDPEQRKKLRVAAMNQPQVEQAPVVIVACGDTAGWQEDLEEIIQSARNRGLMSEYQSKRKRENVSADLGSNPNMSMWVTKQTMIAATTMLWMAEVLGYDTGPMEGFDENAVRQVLEIPPHVRVILLLAIGHLKGEDSRYPGRLPTSRTIFGDRYGEPFDRAEKECRNQ
jgi:nitroreductase